MTKPTDEESSIGALLKLGAEIKYRAAGSVRSVDLRPVCDRVADAELAHVSSLISLDELLLAGTKVGDAGLVHLGGLTKLTSLDLQRTAITDLGLEHLKGLKQLKLLQLSGTSVTREGLKKLRQAMLNTRIVFL